MTPLIVCLAAACLSLPTPARAALCTYCNPLNLDYGPSNRSKARSPAGAGLLNDPKGI
jgi:hypothetical protein